MKNKRGNMAQTQDPDHMQGVKLPRVEESELALIGCALLDNEIGQHVAFEMGIKASEFYNPTYRMIWETCCSMMVEGRALDLSTLHAVIASRDEKADVFNVLAKAESVVISTSAAPEHGRIIRDARQRREVIKKANAIALEASQGQKPIEEQLAEAQLGIYEISSYGRTRRPSIEASASLQPTITEIKNAMAANRRGEVIGATTGLRDLDGFTGGFLPGELIILAARPSIGKTSLAIWSWLACIKSGVPAAYFSLEMGHTSITKRVLCSETRINLDAVTKGHAKDIDLARFVEAGEKLKPFLGYIHDEFSVSAADIAVEARMMKLRSAGRLGLIVVDGLWLLNHESSPGTNMAQRVADTSRKLKALAGELGCPILLLHQLNRQVESRGSNYGKSDGGEKKSAKPTLSDLRDSGAVEQDADMVLLLHRDREDGAAKPGPDGKVNTESVAQVNVDIIVAKNRRGAIGSIGARYEITSQRWADPAKSYQRE